MNQNYSLARDRVALIDLQDEGRFKVSGAQAEAALNELFSIELEAILPWKGTTGLFLTEEAGVIAVATIFKNDDTFYVFTDGPSRNVLGRHLAAELPGRGAHVEDLVADHGWLAVLGPRAQDAMAKAAGEDILGLPYLSCEDNAKLGVPLFRMGHCGEFEYRLLVPLERKDEIAAGILAAGAEFGIGSAEPEVMRTLMLEMRSVGREDLPDGADPIQAGLHWMISFRKDELRAGDVIHHNKHSPPRRSLMVRLDGKGCAADGDRLEIGGEDVGFLARVEYSPTLERDIGLAFVTPDLGAVGVPFQVKGKFGSTGAIGVSAPLFVTKTISAA